MSSGNIRSAQLKAVEEMLSLDNLETSSVALRQWKVLIYDRPCRDIIAPLLSVQNLRDNGVTLHMLIDSNRESIPEVAAIYFIQPSMANVERVADDCARQLYDSVYLNFSTPVSHRVLDALAKRLVQVNAVSLVAKVYDQYLGFVSLEPRLFTLNVKNSFVQYNANGLTDTNVEQYMDSIARGLCSAVVTMRELPVIRCPPGGPAEMVTRKLCATLHSIYNQRHSSGSFVFDSVSSPLEGRSMLLIVDRSIDMAAPLLHTSSYQTLLHDLLTVNLNRVSLDAQYKIANDSGAQPDSTVVLDIDSDPFWAEFASAQLPIAIEEHEKALKSVERQVLAIKDRTGSRQQDGGGTSSLLNAMNSLPLLVDKKKQLERHSLILRAVMDVIAARSIYKFSPPEEELFFHRYVDTKRLLELAADPELTFKDKVRMWAVYVFAANPPQKESDEIEDAALACIDAENKTPESEREKLLNAVKYIKKVQSLARISKSEDASRSPSWQQSGKSAGSRNLWGLASMTQKALVNASRQVKSLVGENKLTAAVDMMRLACKASTSESAADEQDSQLLYFDPKISGVDPVSKAGRIRSSFTSGTLFVVGGGCAVEHQNLCDFASGKFASRSGEKSEKRRFTYGCSEYLNADSFLEQLATCS